MTTKVSGAQFWEKVQRRLALAAHPTHDLPADQKGNYCRSFALLWGVGFGSWLKSRPCSRVRRATNNWIKLANGFCVQSQSRVHQMGGERGDSDRALRAHRRQAYRVGKTSAGALWVIALSSMASIRSRRLCKNWLKGTGAAPIGVPPRLFGVEPPRAPIQAMRTVDMSASNAWAEFSNVFHCTRDAHLEHENAKAGLKA